jgi:hypothetical protein
LLEVEGIESHLQPYWTPLQKARKAIDLLCGHKHVTRASLNNALASIRIGFRVSSTRTLAL